MITDIAAIYRFFKLGQNNFAWANIAFIGVSLLFQLGVVYLQNNKRGWKVMAYEAMIVLLMIKPAIDTSRVAKGEVQEENTAFDPQAELILTKCVEMVAEAIPSSVLQSYAIVSDTDDVSRQAVFSVFISAGCIAFASSTMSMDKDTAPKSRAVTPSFYGYFPDKNRMMLFLLMNLMTTAHVLMKVLACSLMLRLSAIWFWAYLIVDMCIFLLYKLVKGDLRYWMNLNGLLGWIVTFVIRVVVKIIVDFTLIVQFRHPLELGEAYWSFNVISNQVFCFISVYFYGAYSDEASEVVVDVLWKVVTGLFTVSMLNFGLFLRIINKEYLHTFYSTMTGKHFVESAFNEVESDAMKFEIFKHHPSFYTKIDEDLMKWLNDNWSVWEETRPDWFTADAIANVPADMLPVAVLQEMGGVKGRRDSIDAMKKEKEEMEKGGRKQSVRGADLKIIPDVVVEDEVNRVGGGH